MKSRVFAFSFHPGCERCLAMVDEEKWIPPNLTHAGVDPAGVSFMQYVLSMFRPAPPHVTLLPLSPTPRPSASSSPGGQRKRNPFVCVAEACHLPADTLPAAPPAPPPDAPASQSPSCSARHSPPAPAASLLPHSLSSASNYAYIH